MEESRPTKEKDPGHVKFYNDVSHSVYFDIINLESPSRILAEARREEIITRLDEWEFRNLDDDGGTLALRERLMRNDEDAFAEDHEEAKKK